MVGKDGVQGSGLKVTIKKLYQQKKKKKANSPKAGSGGFLIDSVGRDGVEREQRA